LVFRKSYTSAAKFMKCQHEQAHLLAKGRPPLPMNPLPDVQRLFYTSNALHPTQKAVVSLVPLLRTFTLPGELVLDPFCGSASSSAAALLTGRNYLGVEMDDAHHAAHLRMERVQERIARKRSFPGIPTAA
jgi:DNA modification methylase